MDYIRYIKDKKIKKSSDCIKNHGVVLKLVNVLLDEIVQLKMFNLKELFWENSFDCEKTSNSYILYKLDLVYLREIITELM